MDFESEVTNMTDDCSQNDSASEINPPLTSPQSLTGKVLSAAVQLWLRSQVEAVETLHCQITGDDRQVLSGYIPQVFISAQNAVYQGLYLTQVELTGWNIQVNLRQVLRGKPLRLAEVVPVEGEVVMTQADLNTSLTAPLLADAVTEFLSRLVRSLPSAHDLAAEDLGADDVTPQLYRPQVRLTDQHLTLIAELSFNSDSPTIAIRTGLKLVDGQTLQLDRPCWLSHPQAKRGLPLTDLQGFQIDLGTDVHLQSLSLEDGQLRGQGRINITPLNITPSEIVAAQE
jgi:LmeA-like phospholipid-binding